MDAKSSSSRVVVVGAGFAGLSTALMLADRGVAVTVLDKDPEPAPASAQQAVSDWARRGVAQFRQAHVLTPLGHRALRRRLPAVADAVERAGGRHFDYLSLMPVTVPDPTPRPGDDRFTTVTARRPVIEHALASAAGHLDVRPGVAVEGLLGGPERSPGVPSVTGVRTSTGEELRADLVVDATGRGSRLPELVAELGGRPVPEEVESGQFVYYTRFFGARAGSPAPEIPRFPHGGVLQYFDSYALIAIPSDADTWSVTAYISAHDRALKDLRHPEAWTSLIRSCTVHAPLLDGEPLTDVLAMSGSANRWRDLAGDGPVVTGLVPVGDALCRTDPMLGRGMTLGLLQGELLVEAVEAHLDDPLALVTAYAAAVEERIRPWYRDTVTRLRVHTELTQAAVEGRAPAPQAQAARAREMALFAATTRDADLFRAFLDVGTMHATAEEVFARPGFAERVAALGAPTIPRAPGPSRVELLEQLAAA